MQSRPRPAVLLSADATYANFDTALIIVGTTNAKSNRFAHTAHIAPTRGNGLTEDTYFLGQQVQVIPKTWIVRTLGVLSPAELASVERVAKAALGF